MATASETLVASVSEIGDITSVAESSSGRPGRHRLGREPYARVTLSVSPSLMEAVEVLGAHGAGKKATVVRALIETGIAVGGLDAIAAEGGVSGVVSPTEAMGDTTDVADPHPRKPGPGRRRVGRERMVLVSTLMEPATVERIEQVARDAGLPRGQVLRELTEAGLEQVLVTGWRHAISGGAES